MRPRLHDSSRSCEPQMMFGFGWLTDSHSHLIFRKCFMLRAANRMLSRWQTVCAGFIGLLLILAATGFSGHAFAHAAMPTAPANEAVQTDTAQTGHGQLNVVQAGSVQPEIMVEFAQGVRALSEASGLSGHLRPSHHAEQMNGVGCCCSIVCTGSATLSLPVVPTPLAHGVAGPLWFDQAQSGRVIPPLRRPPRSFA